MKKISIQAKKMGLVEFMILKSVRLNETIGAP